MNVLSESQHITVFPWRDDSNPTTNLKKIARADSFAQWSQNISDFAFESYSTYVSTVFLRFPLQYVGLKTETPNYPSLIWQKIMYSP